jgi:hypothetical protein
MIGLRSGAPSFVSQKKDVLLTLFAAGALTCCAAHQASSGTQPDAASGQSVHQGPYTCCAKGEGVGCCTGARPGTCFQYGGVEGDCTPELGTFDGKDICALCCPGLQAISQLTPAEGGATDAGTACLEEGPASLLVCTACGDGRCGPGENSCNCPADCH